MISIPHRQYLIVITAEMLEPITSDFNSSQVVSNQVDLQYHHVIQIHFNSSQVVSNLYLRPMLTSSAIRISIPHRQYLISLPAAWPSTCSMISIPHRQYLIKQNRYHQKTGTIDFNSSQVVSNLLPVLILQYRFPYFNSSQVVSNQFLL